MAADMRRYSKQIKLPGFGLEAQQRLAEAKVLVIGAGGLGCPVILYLSAAGVGSISIIDHDKVDVTNLHRQPIYNTADVGRYKAILAAEKAKANNPGISVEAIIDRLTPVNALEYISAYHLVLDCTDNFATRYLINDACVLADKPWVYGAIEGWMGQVSVFNTVSNGNKGPTYRCLFPEAPSHEDALSCDELGVIGSLPAVIGSYMANEAIKYITGVGKILAGEVLTLDLSENQQLSFHIERDEDAVKAITALLPDYTLASACEAGMPVLSEISAEAYVQDMDRYILVDIREDFEYDSDNAGGLNIPYRYLLEKPEQLNEGNTYLLICDKGIRSKRIAEQLRSKFNKNNVFSLKGGADALKPFLHV